MQCTLHTSCTCALWLPCMLSLHASMDIALMFIYATYNWTAMEHLRACAFSDLYNIVLHGWGKWQGAIIAYAFTVHLMGPSCKNGGGFTVYYSDKNAGLPKLHCTNACVHGTIIYCCAEQCYWSC